MSKNLVFILQSHITMIMKYKITVNGHGYELLGKNVDYRLQSSVKTDSPEDIEGSIHREIHIELYTDLFMADRFIEVTLSSQSVLSGLRIDTKRSKALKSFIFRYERREIQYSGVMEDILVHVMFLNGLIITHILYMGHMG